MLLKLVQNVHFRHTNTHSILSNCTCNYATFTPFSLLHILIYLSRRKPSDFQRQIWTKRVQIANNERWRIFWIGKKLIFWQNRSSQCLGQPAGGFLSNLSTDSTRPPAALPGAWRIWLRLGSVCPRSRGNTYHVVVRWNLWCGIQKFIVERWSSLLRMRRNLEPLGILGNQQSIVADVIPNTKSRIW